MGRHPGDDEAVRARRLDPDGDPAELYYLPTTSPRRATLRPSSPRRSPSCEALLGGAEKYLVLPLLGGLTFYFGIVPPLGERTTYTYHGSEQNVASG